MEWTEQEQERLRLEWQKRAEICRHARQQERKAFMDVAKRATLSVSVTLILIGSVSGWMASALYSPRPLPPSKAKYVTKAQTNNAQYHAAGQFHQTAGDFNQSFTQ